MDSLNTIHSLKADIKEEIRNLAGVTSYNYEKLDDKLDTMNGTLYRMTEKEITQDKAINGLEHAIYGNGRPGLKSEVQDISSQLRRIDSDITELKQEVTNGFAKLSDRQRADDKEKTALEESTKERRLKLAIALIGSAIGGGGAIKIIEVLMGP